MKVIKLLHVIACLIGFSTSQAALTIVNNGAEVYDTRTGLTWQRCLVGQTWNGNACAGTASVLSWADALQLYNAQTGWRVPNIKELSRTIDYKKAYPAVDSSVFPNVPTDQSNNNDLYGVWSSTPVTNQSRASYIYFAELGFASINYSYPSQSGVPVKAFVRLVK